MRIDFECGAGGYEGLSADTNYIYIDGVQYGAYPFYFGGIDVNRFQVETQTVIQGRE